METTPSPEIEQILADFDRAFKHLNGTFRDAGILAKKFALAANAARCGIPTTNIEQID